MKKIDDGFHSWLVGTASFDSFLEIPSLKAHPSMDIPKNLIPFSKMKYSANQAEVVHFYEHDTVFHNFLLNPDRYIEMLYRFPGVITPDCSLYRDMPLVLQMANTYSSRAAGCYMQEQGLHVIPNVRWSDKRSYHQRIIGEIPFAFIGIEKHGTVSISTYGCIRGKENHYHFREGLCSMMEYLEPRLVLVHGAMPQDVFNDVASLAEFHQYINWTAQCRKKVG